MNAGGVIWRDEADGDSGVPIGVPILHVANTTLKVRHCDIAQLPLKGPLTGG